MPAGGVCALNSGADNAAPTVTVIGGVTAGLPTPLVAETLKVNEPATLGTPESTPVTALSSRPVGWEPLANAYVGVGFPLAKNW